jgi:uncharacterized membrane protein
MRDETKTSASSFALPRWACVALIVSLCGNFVLIGMFVMMSWRVSAPWTRQGDGPVAGMNAGHGAEMDHRHHMGLGFGLGRGPLNPHVLADAAPAKREAIHAVLERHRNRIDALRKSSFAARDNAVRVLNEDSLDRFSGALDAVRKADDALEVEVLKIVAECAGVLSADERRAAVAHARQQNDNKPPHPEH